MTCQYCNKPVVLVPSAEERARKFGESAQFYRDLFPNHNSCVIAARQQETLKLVRKLTTAKGRHNPRNSL